LPDAITELVGLWHNRRRSSASVKRIAQKHHDDLAQRIAALQAMQRSLDALLCHCPGNDRPDCPILDDWPTLEGIKSDAPRPAGTEQILPNSITGTAVHTRSRPCVHGIQAPCPDSLNHKEHP
jgi:hypothetical protein